MTISDIEELHREACAAKQTFYKDPTTGLLVFTSYHLSKTACCNSGCRHCPHKTRTTHTPPRILSGSLDDIAEHIDLHFWSGGKDSFLTLRCSTREKVLLTTYDASSGRVALQDIPIADVIRQAEVLDLPLLGVPLGGDYVEAIEAALKKLQDAGIIVDRLVFGDLHLPHIRKWRETELARLGVQLCFPLWRLPYPVLMRWLRESGVVIRISAIDSRNESMRRVTVGQLFDRHFLTSLPDDVDKFGENGEFHTIVEVWNKTSDE